MEYKQPLMIANETLIGTLMKTEILTNNYTINYTNIIRITLQRTKSPLIIVTAKLAVRVSEEVPLTNGRKSNGPLILFR